MRPDEPAPGAPPLRRQLLFVVVAVVAILAFVRVFVAEVYAIPSGSMEPALHEGDRLVVSRLAYLVGEPRRGDVVVFDGRGSLAPATDSGRSAWRAMASAVGSVLGLPGRPHMFVKRVIGVAGDRVACCDADGRMTVNGDPVNEPYVYPGDAASDVEFDVQVPPGRLFVMGDHRSDSADSRSRLGSPGGGTVPVDRVTGRAWVVVWPPSRWHGVS